MDVVSDAIAAIRTGRPHAARTRQTSPWGLRFPPTRRTGFHVVLQGRCWLLSAGREPVALGVGDVVLVPHGDEIALADSPDAALVDVAPEMDDAWLPAPEAADVGGGERTVLMCGSYQLDRAGAHPLLAELPAVVRLPRRMGRRSPLDAVVELLADELDARRPGTDAAIPALLDAMLLYILRAWYRDQAPRDGGWAAALDDPAVGSALQVMHAEPAAEWTVERLSRRTGLSRSAFSRRFTELVGTPPMGYLTWWRMTTAARILRSDGDAPLAAVAERVGYASEFAFNRAFKRELGVSPGAYRRRGTGRREADRRDSAVA